MNLEGECTQNCAECEILGYDDVDENKFLSIVELGRPAIIKKASFGPCSNLWNLDYLSGKLRDKSVIYHESNSEDLNFIKKNFKYKQSTFKELAFILEQQASQKLPKSIYLRSVASEKRGKKAANIRDDFPEIADDFIIPEYMSELDIFSTILRISTNNLQVWTHFDLYDNILHQIVGSRRITLFEPRHSEFLYMKGDKSLVDNVETIDFLKYPLLDKAKMYTTNLKPGDSIYIPSCWWHNIRNKASSHRLDHTIGVNIFWKDPHVKDFYAANDVYGNANLTLMDPIFNSIEKATCDLKKLPEKYKYIYKQMIIEKISNALDT